MLHTWASFRESDGALAGAYTSVGIILPERVYSPEVWESTVSGELKAGDNGKLSVFEQELARGVIKLQTNDLRKELVRHHAGSIAYGTDLLRELQDFCWG